MNHTFIVLIPKVDRATRVHQFQPITLCNVMFKFITKILAGRLRHLLENIISPAQAAFVPHQNITDNTILNHEVMHFMNTHKGKYAYMSMKIDMAKAYGRIESDPLKHILALHGFSLQFINLLNECVSTPTYSILINDAPCGFFLASRGIRQGDPMSPTLFTILFDLLSKILSRTEMEGKFHGIKVSKTCTPISHLMYADNLVVYCKADLDEAAEVLKYI